MQHKQPHKAVIDAYIHKATRMSRDVERMARYGRDWLPDDELLRQLWRAQHALYEFSKQLQQQ